MWNDYLKHVEKSQTLLLNEQSRNLEKDGQEVYKFGFGQSPFPPLSSAIKSLQENAARKDYAPVQGLPELCERAARFHSQVDQIDIRPNQVLVAPGSKILIYSVMAAFSQADLLVPAPAWVSYAPQAKLLGHTPIKVHTDFEARWRVLPDAIEAAVKTKANPSTPTLLILNYPGNPDGLGYSAEELQALVPQLRRHNILVISDEIYGLLDHAGKHTSLARFYPEGTIVTTGLSKWCGAGGWRLGLALLPDTLTGSFKETLLGVASETYSCATLPVQIAACSAYQWNDEVQTYLAHQRRLLSQIGPRMAKQISDTGVRVHQPTGGFYLFLDFTPFADKMRAQGIETSNQLCERLLADTGVALLPGDAFGMDSNHLTARLAYVEFDGKAALAASQEVGLGQQIDETLFSTIFGKTLRGTDKLTQWLKS